MLSFVARFRDATDTYNTDACGFKASTGAWLLESLQSQAQSSSQEAGLKTSAALQTTAGGIGTSGQYELCALQRV